MVEPQPGRVGCLPLVPLAAALLSIPWFLMVIVSLITEAARTTQGANMRAMAALAILPATAGLLAGIAAAAFGKVRGSRAWSWLIVGALACGLAILVLGQDLFR